MAVQRRRYATDARKNFEIGACLGRSFGAWTRNFLPVALLNLLICFVPIAALIYWLYPDPSGVETVEEMRGFRTQLAIFGFALLVAVVVFPNLASGCVTPAIVRHLKGEPASFAQALGEGLGRFLPILGVAILFIVCFVGIALVSALAGFVHRYVSLGVMILLGSMTICALWVAVPCAAVERPGVFGAIRRSTELTRGQKARIFVVLLILLAINFGLNKLVETLVVESADTYEGIRTGIMISHAIQTLLQFSLWSVVVAVSYHDLRVAREGVSTEDIAKVFD